MDILIGLLIVVIIIGALIGGKNFGDTIRKGCGFLVLLLIVVVAGIYFISSNNEESYSKEIVISNNEPANFMVLNNCSAYTKPNKNSQEAGYLTAGVEVYVEEENKFNYFYELYGNNGSKIYVLKEDLKKLK